MKIENVETFLVSLPFDSGGAGGWESTAWTSLDYVLVRIDTDAGISGWGDGFGYGAAHATRAAIEHMIAPGLIGRDARDIAGIARSLQFQNHIWGRYGVTMFALSGIDIALWDIAGKITGQPVNVLLGGPFRDAIPMYSHGIGVKLLDPASCREWAGRIKAAPEGFTAFKIGIDPMLGVPSGRYASSLDSTQVRNVARGFSNAREAAGDGIDIAVHCHNELDTLSAVQCAKAVEPMNPLFYEDPLHVGYSEGWMALRRATRIPILAGEKLELVQGFKPFLDHQAADIIHPDLAFAGGFTGTRKIADYAMISRTPVALHNVGSLVLCFASAHFGSAIHNFYRSESALGRPTRHVEQMAAANPPDVKNGRLKVPEVPGLGFEPNNDYLRSQLVDGEPFWS